jgi:hypothetical protein
LEFLSPYHFFTLSSGFKCSFAIIYKLVCILSS